MSSQTTSTRKRSSSKSGSRQVLQPKYEIDMRLPHPRQHPFIRTAAKRKICRAGRRGGKTIAVAILAVEEFVAGKRVLYAAPTSDQLQSFWDEVVRSMSAVIGCGLYTKNETEHSIEKPGTKTRIRAKTAWNADTLRGDYADLLILDEWQMMHESAWNDVGAPMLLDNNGDAVFIYTPPSLRMRAGTKAEDPLHAAKMFKQAQLDQSGRWKAFHWTSHDNPTISKEALSDITQDMTQLSYLQEIMAEDIEDVPGSLWKREVIEKTRISKMQMPELVRIGVGIDPTGSTTNEAGIVAAGLGADGHGYVLNDSSLLGSPEKWSQAAVSLYWLLEADCIVAEKNYGGDMVESTIRTANKENSEVRIIVVNSTRGKLVRAEPVCSLYERGMIHHVGKFTDLEDQMCTYVPGDKSPNRMDALVFILSALMLRGTASMAEVGMAAGGLGKPISAGLMTMNL